MSSKAGLGNVSVRRWHIEPRNNAADPLNIGTEGRSRGQGRHRLLGFQEVTSGGLGDGGLAGPKRRVASQLGDFREDRCGEGLGARI